MDYNLNCFKLYFLKLLLIGFAINFGVAFGQTDEIEIRIQDTVYFNSCNTETYQYIDFYKKTRFEENDTHDLATLYQWEFYNTFFNTGDFDVSRMPCSLAGKFGIIKHIMQIASDDQIYKTVIIALVDSNTSAAYITEEAFINDELTYVPKE